MCEITKLGGRGIAYFTKPRTSTTKLKKFILKADTISKLLPASVDMWKFNIDETFRKLGQKRGMGAEAKIKLMSELRNRWFARARAASHGRHYDVTGLSLKKFHQMFPDSKEWVLRLAGRKDRSVKGLFKATGYKGDPLLFTMFACLFAEPGLRRVSATQINKNRGSLVKAAKDYHKEHGFNPHPAVLMQICGM